MYPYEVEQDSYCYEGTSVLKNLADIRDAALLEQFELEMSTLRAEEPLPEGSFDPKHYCSVHRHLFQDVYEWAGQCRKVRTAKGGNWFCYPEHISNEMARVFKMLENPSFSPGSTVDSFVGVAADFLGELNAVHPFREGNGRSQLSFLHLVGIRAEHPFAFGRIQREAFMPAMIASFSTSLEPLKSELRTLLA